MAVSSYQIQRLMTRLRLLRGLDAAPPGMKAPGGIAEEDRVRVSERARRQAAEAAASLRLPAGAPVPVVTIVDDAPLPPETLRELERRAGSFMRPPVVPAAGALRFPRARRPVPAAGGSGPLAGEDLPDGS
jgi:hypothetical protein